MRVDAHQHFWRMADRAGAWPPAELHAIHRDFGPQDLAPLLRENGIDATVLVQSLPTAEDTAFLLETARSTDFVRGVVGWADLKAADAAHTIEALARDPLLKGLRPMLQDLPDDNWIADPALAPAAAAMARHGLVFDALVMPRHLASLHSFAAAHPTLAIVVDHAAKPSIARGTLAPWRTDMARLAALPHVHCKLSGLLTEAAPGAGRGALQPFVQAVWTLFGPHRLLWGSDWPVLRLASDYTAWRAMAEALIDAVDPAPSDADRAALFGGNAAALYRL
ncbi:MAG TPA: amidohydrolase family protein [Ideonella sp.]|uniref:amidohydrolase family protein n=1 Tax=Ideonella sp. TaxID=1929293 RepID=UPI002C8103EF|nr:amidohydrolase family protein [Ideonella sp.]HSI50698.1 amidohydrolase family protein [Ideonella sp.]